MYVHISLSFVKFSTLPMLLAFILCYVYNHLFCVSCFSTAFTFLFLYVSAYMAGSCVSLDFYFVEFSSTVLC